MRWKFRGARKNSVEFRGVVKNEMEFQEGMTSENSYPQQEEGYGKFLEKPNLCCKYYNSHNKCIFGIFGIFEGISTFSAFEFIC